jgi:hypothetical protein
MKTVFTTQEGVKMNSQLNFGNTAKIKNEFQFLMTTYETLFDEEFDYFYRITPDGYIQLAYSYNKSSLEIRAQYKLKFDLKKENIKYIVFECIEANHFYNGMPKLKNSDVFTHDEFDEIIFNIENPKNIQKERARKKITPLISFIKQQQLYPKPTGFNENSWTASCPSGGKHFIQIVTTNDQWGCGYCHRKGGLIELKHWLQELKSIKD